MKGNTNLFVTEDFLYARQRLEFPTFLVRDVITPNSQIVKPESFRSAVIGLFKAAEEITQSWLSVSNIIAQAGGVEDARKKGWV